MFKNTSQFQSAVSIINDIESSKIQIFLQKLIQQQITKQEIFDLNKKDSFLLFDSCSYVFEQALYHSIDSNTLMAQLEESGVNKSKEFGLVWKEYGKTYQQKISEKGLGNEALTDISYRLSIKMSQESLSKQKNTTTLFEFKFGEHQDPLLVEFTKDELYQFFLKLEQIQGQLDTLQ